MVDGAIGYTGGNVLCRVVMASQQDSDIARTPHRHTEEQPV